MPKQHWLVKSEPGTYSWDDLVRDGSTVWDGVKNPLALRHLAAMRKGDLVLFYHSGTGKHVVGVARVAREAWPDPKLRDPRRLVVELSPVKPLAQPVTLAEIKADPQLAKLPLVRQPRLSVMPVDAEAFERIVERGR
jgi:predicted RNA-binding protein with PUA-like domain